MGFQYFNQFQSAVAVAWHRLFLALKNVMLFSVVPIVGMLETCCKPNRFSMGFQYFNQL